MRFRTTLELGGKTATGFRVPPEAVAALGRGKKPAVRVTIGSFTYRSTIAAYGDDYYLPLSAERRAATGLAAGDEFEVSLELDTEPRTVDVPEDLAAAIAADPSAQATFDRLSYSQKQWYVLPIGEAKKPETRERRIAKALDMLREGRTR